MSTLVKPNLDLAQTHRGILLPTRTLIHLCSLSIPNAAFTQSPFFLQFFAGVIHIRSVFSGEKKKTRKRRDCVFRRWRARTSSRPRAWGMPQSAATSLASTPLRNCRVRTKKGILMEGCCSAHNLSGLEWVNSTYLHNQSYKARIPKKIWINSLWCNIPY